jgi:hypothetical protein
MAFFDYEPASVSTLSPGWTWIYGNRAYNVTGYFFYIDGSAPAARVGGPGTFKNTVDLAIVNNTCHFTSTSGQGLAHDAVNTNVDASTLFVNNIFTGTPGQYLLLANPTRGGKTLTEQNNLWFGATGGTPFTFAGTTYATLAAYQAGSAQGSNDKNVSPQLADNGPGLAPNAGSPVIDAGQTAAPTSTGLIYAASGSPDYLYSGAAPDIGAVELFLSTFNPAIHGGYFR